MPDIAGVNSRTIALRHGPVAVELLAMLSRITKCKASVAEAARLILKSGPQAYLHHAAANDAPTFCALLGEILSPDGEGGR
jgi:hypothetical protein